MEAGVRGTKKKIGIDEQFLDVIENYTASDPMQETVRWTHLKPRQIAEALLEKYQQNVSVTVIKKLLEKHGFRRRNAQKKITMGNSVNRNEQFEKIAVLRKKYADEGNPVMSMDTKKKEMLGNFYRDGHLYTQETVPVNDHDFRSSADGIIIPHALYDSTFHPPSLFVDIRLA